MGSLENTEARSSAAAAGIAVELYRWVVGTLAWSRRSRRGAMGYRRLNAPPAVGKKRVRLARLGSKQQRSNSSRPRSSLKIKRLMHLRLRLSWLSPFTLLAKLQDAYVSFLQAASHKLALTEGLASFPGLPTSDFGPPSLFGGGGGGGSSSLKAKEAELDKILHLYLARTRPQLLLTDDP